MSWEHRPVLERHMAAFNAQDPDAFPWTDEIEFVVPGAGRLQGREAVLDFMRGFWQAFPDVRIEAVRTIGEGTTAAVDGRFAGTHTGPMRTPDGEVPATGRRVEFRWMSMYEFSGDALVSEHLFFDQVDLLGQLGLMPG